MNFIASMMRMLIASDSLSDHNPDVSGLANTVLDKFRETMGWVMPIILTVVAGLGVIFCVKLGLAYAKAEETSKREEAKKHLVAAVIGFGIGIVAAAIMWWLFQSNLFANLFN